MTVAWIRAAWPAPAGVIAGCTTRIGGVSTGSYESLNLGTHTGDIPDAVRTNRRRFVEACALPSAPIWLSQVHGSRVTTEPSQGEEADASFSSEADVVCAVMVADCLPVLFASDDGERVAAAHAGWRGLAAGVLENTVDAFSCPPAAILAWLGPAISQPAFEVGAEVRAAFVDQDPAAARCFVANERGRWQADLYALAKERLKSVGVARIFGGGFCTFGEAERFFSYRRDGQCGRMAAFVFRSAANA